MRIRTYNRFPQNHFANEAAWNHAMNRFFNGPAYDYGHSGGNNGDSTGESNGNASSKPTEQETLLPLDVWTTPDAFQINAYLPGVNPEDVEITFEGDELLVRGKLPTPTEGEGVEFLKRELFHGAFARRVNFNVPVDAERIEAHFHNGLLTLTVPKAEAVKPKQIKIQTK